MFEQLPLTVIGLSGKAGVGKDTLADSYLRSHGFLPIALADAIKNRVVASGQATWEEVFVTKPTHVRRLLQLEGTERGRDVYGEDYWINLLFAQLQTNAARWGAKFAAYVVTDVRFPNEVTRLQQAGGKVIRVVAPERYLHNGMSDEARSHRSETALDEFPLERYDAVLHNDYAHQATVGHALEETLQRLGLLSPKLSSRFQGVRFGAVGEGYNQLRIG